VTEHQAQSRRCSCGTLTKAEFPAEAKVAANYGPVVRAVAVYLMAGQHLPVARTAALLAQVGGAPVSTGWLAGLPAEASTGLAPFLDELRAQLVAEDVLHADETGSRISGARYWFHVACNGLLTLLDCHPRRGVEALEDMAVLPFFKGVLVSDGWKPYWSIEGVEHALCCAHLLRDLASLTSSPTHRGWADEMADLLVEAKGAVERSVTAGTGGLSAGQLKAYRSRYTRLINRGVAALPARHQPGSVHRDACNLLRRLRDQRDEVTRYWVDPAVSFDNNQAERDLRMASCSKRSAAASGPSPAPRPSARCAAISRQLKNMGWPASMCSSSSSRGPHGCHRPPPRRPEPKAGHGPRYRCAQGGALSPARKADRDLDSLIAEITVDCNDEYEQLTGFEVVFDEDANFPCPGTVVGEEVEVLSVAIKDNRRELIASCKRNGHRYDIALLDVDLRPDPATSRLVAAYRRWLGY
jgi:hypothetical protein